MRSTVRADGTEKASNCITYDDMMAELPQARWIAARIAAAGNGEAALRVGRSNHGMMRVVADAAQAAGGKIVGISVEPIKARARPNADEMIIARDWPERRATLLARGDVIAVLPGGLGTLDEITEVLEYKKTKHSQ